MIRSYNLRANLSSTILRRIPILTTLRAGSYNIKNPYLIFHTLLH